MSWEQQRAQMTRPDSKDTVRQSDQKTDDHPVSFILNLLRKQQFVDDEEIQFENALQAHPHLFEHLMCEQFGSSKRLKKVLEAIKSNEQIILSIQSLPISPLHTIFTGLFPLKNSRSLLFLPGMQVTECEPAMLLKQASQSLRVFCEKGLDQSQTVQEILCYLYECLFDVLIRKGNLLSKIREISLIAASKKVSYFSRLNAYDFLCLFTKIIPRDNLSHFGHLLHTINLPIPIITSVKDSSWIPFFEPSLIENVLLEGDFNLICNLGSQMAEGKGKTSLITDIFQIENESLSQMTGHFHKKCTTLFTNVKSRHSCMIADFHGSIDDFSVIPQISSFLGNSCLFLLHIHAQEVETVKAIVNKVDNINHKAKIIILVRDSPQFVCQTHEYEMLKLPRMQHLNHSDRKRKQINQKIVGLINHYLELQEFSNNAIEYSKLTQNLQTNQGDGEETIIDFFVSSIHEAYRSQTLWTECFQNLHQYQQLAQVKNQKHDLQSKLREEKSPSPQLVKLYQKVISEQKKWEGLINKHPKNYSTLILKYFNCYQTLNIRHLITRISAWKAKFTHRIQEKYLDLRLEYSRKPANSQLIVEEMKKAENELEELDVSVDTIIQQIIVLMGPSPNPKYQSCLRHYYFQLYRKGNPIVLIDGKTLIYGNSFIGRILQQIQRQMDASKKIYVVSVIGAQSSAKSTLLNYLFNCRFQTSAGRCTKGVCFTVVETEGEAVIVIDTEGLMSVSARDRTFDIQISSFIFLISDLVIINNKGQISTSIKELLGICTSALRELHQSRDTAQKSKIFFAIRDQLDAGVSKQQAMLASIISSLTQKEYISEYKDLLDFDSNDIFSLGSAYRQEIGENTVRRAPNFLFSQQVLAMRVRIFEFLKTKPSRKFSNFSEFYSISEGIWTSIRQQGSQIFNCEEVLKIRLKSQLHSIKDTLLAEELKRLSEKYRKCSQQIQINEGADVLDRCASILRQSLQQRVPISQGFLKERAKRAIRGIKDSWIAAECHDLRNSLEQRNLLLLEMLEQKYRQSHNKKKLATLDSDLHQIMKKFLRANKTKQEFEKQANQVLQSRQSQFSSSNELILGELVTEKLKESKGQVHQFDRQTQCMPPDQKFNYYFEATALKVLPIGSALQIDNKVQLNQQVDNELKEISVNIIPEINKKFGEPTQISQLDKIFTVFSLSVEESVRTINSNIQTSRLPKAVVSHILFKNKTFIRQAYQLLISTIPSIIIRNRKQRKLQAEKSIEDKIKNKMQEIDNLYGMRGDNNRIALKIITDFTAEFSRKLLEVAEKIIDDKFRENRSKFSPSQILDRAMYLTFNAPELNKTTYIQCYKMVADCHRFLKEEVLGKLQEYTTLQQQITRQQNEAIIKSENLLKNMVIYVKRAENLRQLKSTLEIDILDVHEYEQRNQYGNIQNMILHHLSGEGLKRHLEAVIKSWASQKKKTVESRILGCSSQCPFCSMKCRLPADHEEGHECAQFSQLQVCFGGKSHQSRQRCSNFCFSDRIIKSTLWTYQDRTLRTFKYLLNKHPDWILHLSNGSHQKPIDEERCEKIWANIGDVLIETKYPRNKNTKVRNQLITEHLTKNDVWDWLK